MEGQTGTWLLLVLVLVLVLVLNLREKRELVFPVNHALMEYFEVPTTSNEEKRGRA